MSDVFVPSARPPADSDNGGREKRWFVVRQGEVLVSDTGDFPAGKAADVGAGARDDAIYLGTLGGVPAYAVGVADDAAPPDGMRFDHLRALAGRLPDRQWALAGRAVQLVEWDR